jgi:hypothetical protein
MKEVNDKGLTVWLVRLCICVQASSETTGISGMHVRSSISRPAGILTLPADEMNGNWYPYAGDPAGFRASWEMLANAVHAGTTDTCSLTSSGASDV